MKLKSREDVVSNVASHVGHILEVIALYQDQLAAVAKNADTVLDTTVLLPVKNVIGLANILSDCADIIGVLASETPKAGSFRYGYKIHQTGFTNRGVTRDTYQPIYFRPTDGAFITVSDVRDGIALEELIAKATAATAGGATERIEG